MFFRRTTSYAFRALLHMSAVPPGTVQTSGEVAKSIHLPKEYISKILQQLVKCKIVGSKKGKGGGFFLAKKVNEIRLIDVVVAVEDNFDMDICVFGMSKCNSSCNCPVHESYGKLKEDFRSMLINNNIGQLGEIKNDYFPFMPS